MKYTNLNNEIFLIIKLNLVQFYFIWKIMKIEFKNKSHKLVLQKIAMVVQKCNP